MKVYVVFITTKVYQEIGNVHTNLEQAKKEADKIRNQLEGVSPGYPGAIVVERELKTESISSLSKAVKAATKHVRKQKIGEKSC